MNPPNVVFHFSFHDLFTSCELSVAPATMAASSVEATAPSMETSAAEAAPMEAAKAGLSPEGIGSCNTSMIEPAEGARMHSSRHVWCVASVKARVPGKTAAMEVG